MDFTDLAAAVIDLVDAVQEERGEPVGAFAYAGDSASGRSGSSCSSTRPTGCGPP